jgi:hypothetical protein
MMPDDAEFHYNLALALEQQGDHAAAAAELDKVVSADSPSGFMLADLKALRPFNPVTVAIRKNDSLALSEDPISWDDLGNRISSIYSIRAQRVMCIAPESVKAFLRVEQVAHIAINAGVDRLCLVPPGTGTVKSQ